MPFGERALFSGAMIAGVSASSASSAASSVRPACRRVLRRSSVGLGASLSCRLLGCLVVLLVVLLVGGLFVRRGLANRDAVLQAEHDHDGVRLLGGRISFAAATQSDGSPLG